MMCMCMWLRLRLLRVNVGVMVEVEVVRVHAGCWLMSMLMRLLEVRLVVRYDGTRVRRR
jgi:hypothetical protein